MLVDILPQQRAMHACLKYHITLSSNAFEFCSERYINDETIVNVKSTIFNFCLLMRFLFLGSMSQASLKCVLC